MTLIENGNIDNTKGKKGGHKTKSLPSGFLKVKSLVNDSEAEM
ncbi:hypothetical protein [Flammeovirga kamogawensis]|nr:hypothetical protein [Flammeovirga kamogawensis]MBB6464076.1 hypothetical protein [Flammeovirga kamogawensis]